MSQKTSPAPRNLRMPAPNDCSCHYSPAAFSLLAAGGVLHRLLSLFLTVPGGSSSVLCGCLMPADVWERGASFALESLADPQPAHSNQWPSPEPSPSPPPAS